ncbi:MAG: acyltransferase [Desulfosalsimonadaceae bacterium]
MPGFVRGALTFCFYILFTTVIFFVMQLVVLLKFLIPEARARSSLTRVVDFLASTCWVFCANTTNRLFARTQIHMGEIPDVNSRKWCLLLSNHQSWVDILVILRVFFRRLPPYKFFVKKELLWLPFIGQAFWALDFPIMKRYSREFTAKHPHLKGIDLEAARRACEKFQERPVTVMNFVEGTRFTPAKHRKQQSPYSHLLKPRAGGTALVLYAMGDVLEQIVDVTIIYPEGVPGLWQFFCGRCREVVADVRILHPGSEIIGNYYNDPEFKASFQSWINGLWRDKDERISRLLSLYQAK